MKYYVVKIDAVAELLRGISYKKDQAISYHKDGYVPILRANNIDGDLNFEDLVYVPELLVDEVQYIKKGDIVFAMSSGSKHLVGKSAIAKKDIQGSYGAFCGLLRIKENAAVIPNYLSYFFKGSNFRKYISEIAKGTNINNLKREHILDIELPLPPLPIQHAIVAKLETLFSELDKGIEQLKTAQQQLRTYRQAVLKAAFEGRLTGEKAKEGELPEGWRWIKMGEVALAIDPQPSHRTPPLDEQGIPYVGIGEIDKNTGTIDFANARKVPNSVLDEHISRYSLIEGDFIIGKIGTIGKPFKVPTKRFYALSANVVLVQANREKVSPSYLFYLCQSNLIEKQFQSGSKATTQAAFGIKKVRELEIPICGIQEQYDVVSEIESRLSLSYKLEETLGQELQQTEALRQSILKKAFDGELHL